MLSSDVGGLSPAVTGVIVGCSLTAVLVLALYSYIMQRRRDAKAAAQAAAQSAAPPSLDLFLSSRGSQGWVSIGLSLYATAVGTWTLTAPAETAVTYGWWGATGYIIAIGGCWSTFLFTGPRLRKYSGKQGFTSLAFIENRFGKPVRIISSLNSLVYMGLVMVSEMVAMLGCIKALSADANSIGCMVAVALVVCCFAVLGGMPSTFLGDKICAIATVALLVVTYTAVFAKVAPDVDGASWRAAQTWQPEGIPTGLVLIFCCFLVEQANQSSWQRVFAAKTVNDSRKGFLLGMALLTPSMLLFSFAGFVGLAAANAGVVNLQEGEAYATVFVLLAALPRGLAGLVLLLVVVLVSSTLWTMQAGVAALLADELNFWNADLTWARLLAAVLLVPICIVAGYNPPSVLQLMMIGNIVTVCVVPVSLLGFWPIVTTEGVVCGIVSAFLTVFIYGAAATRSFTGGFEWFTFPDGYDWNCLATFLLAVFVSYVVALVGSSIHFRCVSGTYERQEAILRKMAEEQESIDADKPTEAAGGEAAVEEGSLFVGGAETVY